MLYLKTFRKYKKLTVAAAIPLLILDILCVFVITGGTFDNIITFLGYTVNPTTVTVFAAVMLALALLFMILFLILVALEKW